VKAGFYSPLPPARTGVADYSEALLKALQHRLDVEVNAREADIRLYHIGNNQLHRPIYEQALRQPGVVVLHDAVLQHFFLGSLDEHAYIEEFVYNYGAWSEDLARSLWLERARSAADARYFAYPMLKRIATTSRGVVVHNPAAANLVKQHAPGADVVEIPHLFEPREPAPVYEVERLRSKLGVLAGTFLFGVFGHLRESKRIAAILRSLEKARPRRPVALLVAGEFASSDLARSLEPELCRPSVIRAGYLPEHDFWLHAAAVDACVNLRYPQAGETSGIAIRLMGIGKPVVVSGGCETSRFPESCCIRLENGPAEEDMLTEIMLWLAAYPADARAIGERAAAHIRQFHSLERVADLYQKYLTACYHRST
jgi:glycosyltransferase involved in cell wall biosynthesis